MDWNAFQRLKVKDAPAWSLDLVFIPVAILAIEWLWLVEDRPALAVGAGVLVIVVRQLTRHFAPPRQRHTENGE